MNLRCECRVVAATALEYLICLHVLRELLGIKRCQREGAPKPVKFRLPHRLDTRESANSVISSRVDAVEDRLFARPGLPSCSSLIRAS